MRLGPTLKAIAFILNGAVFLVGIARLQGRLAPPDVIYVGLLLVAPVASALTLVLGYRKRTDPEVMATAEAVTIILNLLLLGFVVWLTAHLDPDTRAEQWLWLVVLFSAPPVNAAALRRAASRAP